MVDELLPYYNDELTYIRQLAAEFAASNPKIASRLRISTDTVEDPHVARLIEAFAFLNARIRHKLDDDYPELTDALLGVMYPHYLSPVPSMSIVRLEAAKDLAGPYRVDRGTEIETERVDGEPCRFHTTYDTTLWPVAVESATMTGPGFGSPTIPGLRDVESVLKLVIKCNNDDLTFANLKPDCIRFFLRGQSQHTLQLYELLFNNLLHTAVIFRTADGAVTAPDSTASIEPVGYEEDEGMLPYSEQSFSGYRLLTEYFTFPQKFLFFDLVGLNQPSAAGGHSVEVYFYFSGQSNTLEQNVNRSTFALGCTPIVNLFNKRTEPIPLDHTLSEYRIVPDARRPKAAEVYSVDGVSAFTSDNTQFTYNPFYGLDHATSTDEQSRFYKTSRREGSRDNPGSELFLSIVDLGFNPAADTGWVLNINATCFNRDLPNRLPFGGGEPRMTFTEGASAVTQIECLTAPTRTLRPPLRHGALWRLISHLTLNHLSITDNEQGADALREILRLYDFRESPETRAHIEGIVKVYSQPATARVVVSGRGALARGVEITIELDRQRYEGGSAFLLATLLERFLGLYCNVNSFTRLVVKYQGREEILNRWPARAGDRTLI